MATPCPVAPGLGAEGAEIAVRGHFDHFHFHVLAAILNRGWSARKVVYVSTCLFNSFNQGVTSSGRCEV